MYSSISRRSGFRTDGGPLGAAPEIVNHHVMLFGPESGPSAYCCLVDLGKLSLILPRLFSVATKVEWEGGDSPIYQAL